jgi:flagellar biosynthesis/type III secretory pathway protein FliH
MFAFGGILRQFRGGVPGAPVSAGVPVDRRAELEAELAPVLARLDQSVREAEAIVAGARAEAERRRALAVEQATQLVARARAAAEAERRRAASERLAGADAARQSLLDAAAAEVERINRRAQERVPSLVTELAARLLDRSP